MERKAYELLESIERSWWYRGRAAAVHTALKKCGIVRCDNVLDFGSGCGGMSDTLRAIGNRVYAFEPDNASRTKAQKRGYVYVYPTEKEALGHTYDLIALFDVLEHIQDDVSFLSCARAALSPGGCLLITVPAHQFLWSAHDINHHHARRYSRRSLRKTLRVAGYNIEYLSHWNFLAFFPAVLMRLIGRSGEGALRLPVWADSILYGIVYLESLIGLLVRLPIGLSMVIIARKI